MRKAIILLSGGLDSLTVLALAKSQGYHCYALNFMYGQRHQAELAAAVAIAQLYAVEYKQMLLGLDQFGGSALTDPNIEVPQIPTSGIPVTYVPARNTIFLSFALAWAEVISVQDIFIGVNAIDYSGYPDCRPAFIQAFEQMANLATKTSVEGKLFCIHTPLIDKTKAQIIQLGTELAVDYSLTVSCYIADAQGRACGQCDACRLRSAGFEEAGVVDVTHYRT